jgi:hypothetical protein
MDACHLEKNRVDACVFMVATAEGPLSMCLHNAKRDEYILKPIRMKAEATVAKFWDPLTGGVTEQAEKHETLPEGLRVPLKGRQKEAMKRTKARARAQAVRQEGPAILPAAE